MKHMQDIFNTPAKDKKTEKAFLQSIAVSVLGILLCMTLLCSVTWAWFSANVTSPENTIQAGDCTVTVAITQAGNTVDPNTGSTDTYTLAADTAYQVTLTADGTVQSAYCKLMIGGQEHFTEQLATVAPQNTITFTLIFTQETEVQIITRWGTYHVSNDARDFYSGQTYTDLVAAP